MYLEIHASYFQDKKDKKVSILGINSMDLVGPRACIRNLDLRVQSFFIEKSSGPQNLRVQKVMPQRSTGSCTRYTRANAFPGSLDILFTILTAA